MTYALERSISLYRQTSGPLRCLSERDPCNLRGAIQSRPNRKATSSKRKGQE